MPTAQAATSVSGQRQGRRHSSIATHSWQSTKVYAIADRWRKESGRQSVPLLVQAGQADALIKVHDSANQAAVVKQVVEVIQK